MGIGFIVQVVETMYSYIVCGQTVVSPLDNSQTLPLWVLSAAELASCSKQTRITLVFQKTQKSIFSYPHAIKIFIF